MSELAVTILSTVITAVVLPLLAFATNALIKWLGSKAKSERAASIMTTATGIVSDAVGAVAQTYVDSLKKSQSFTIEAQQEALNLAKDTALGQMNDDVRTYIRDNYGDLDRWITTHIEAILNER